MTVSVVLFTADLRLHDNPALHAAVREADEVVPLFVYDDGVRAAGFDAPNRRAFLADCLTDLDAGLRERGGRLVVRSGDVVEQVCAVVAAVGAGRVHLAGGPSRYAVRRETALREALPAGALVVHDAVVTALAPGEVTPAGADHYAVFTPYLRRWTQAGVRDVVPPPRRVRVPEIASEPLRPRTEVSGTSPGLARGGERAGRERLRSWLASGLDGYEDGHDDLAADTTSRLSPFLHFGALSAAELVHRARRGSSPGSEAFVRQLAWRDFHYQVLAARPGASDRDYRPRGDRWHDDEREIEAWRAGRTGYPLVDAAMRQLAHEGWMHNRGRLLAASFLTKTLYADWRIGARHFLDLLVDGDIANNQMNWQWAAGTGTDTRPNRVLNPVTQGKRLDPRGTYVRRWIPELADVADRHVHEPWKLPPEEVGATGYPGPLVELGEGRGRFERGRGHGRTV